MSKRSTYLVLIIAACMGLVYVAPIWFIEMTGRQFTEPLSIYIWVHKVTGGAEHDLYTINDFNHYIGMKKIYPDSIPELRFMPYVLAYMILGALVTFWIRKPFLIVLGLVNIILVSIAGFYDFHRWLYNYGTDLDTDAPLYDKSVDFQPPLLACKDILNITTCSWPHLGGLLLFASGGILIYILWYEKKLKDGAS